MSDTTVKGGESGGQLQRIEDGIANTLCETDINTSRLSQSNRELSIGSSAAAELYEKQLEFEQTMSTSRRQSEYEAEVSDLRRQLDLQEEIEAKRALMPVISPSPDQASESIVSASATPRRGEQMTPRREGVTPLTRRSVGDLAKVKESLTRFRNDASRSNSVSSSSKSVEPRQEAEAGLGSVGEEEDQEGERYLSFSRRLTLTLTLTLTLIGGT